MELSSKISNASSVTTSVGSPDSMQKNKLNKDSCLDFHLGKENVMNGKTTTVK